MTALRKKSSPRPASRTSTGCTARSSPSAASARTSAGRTNSACSFSSAASRSGTIARIGIVLEEAVGDRAQAIVRARQRLAHRVAGPRIVEAGQQDQRAIPDVAVGVLGDRPQQRRHGLRARVSAGRCATRPSASRSRDRPACRSRPEAAPARRTAARTVPAPRAGRSQAEQTTAHRIAKRAIATPPDVSASCRESRREASLSW